MSLKRLSQKFFSVLLSLVLITQYAGLLIPQLQSVAEAAPICVTDSAGADDVPGQKDLTRMCVDNAAQPTSISVSWNWDETGTNGNNSLDACALFDTDGDGRANNAVCIVTNGNPATFSSLVTYSCGDTRFDRCTSTSSIISSGATTCTVAQTATNPFNAGNDATATCAISLATIGAAGTLIDVCSFPSSQPNSDPSDCIVARGTRAKLEVRKALTTTSTTDTFNLRINTTTYATAVRNGGATGEVLLSDGTYTVGETAASGNLTDYNQSVVCRDLNGTGTIVASNQTGSTVNVTLNDRDDVICVITNTQKTATITLVKNIANPTATTTPALPNDFNLTLNNKSVLSGVPNTITPGTYTASETNLSGYSAGSWTGTGCNANGTITVVANQNITCTITNTAIAPTVTLIKKVATGTALPSSFQLTLNGQNTNQNTKLPLIAGTVYTVGEVATTGYTTTSTTCRELPEGDAQEGTSFTPKLGTDYECTVTNTAIQPKLKLIKQVSDPNKYATTLLGPSEFQLTLNGENVPQNTYLNNITADTNYIISEVERQGYELDSIVCVDTITNSKISSVEGIKLSLGQDVTCTVTNTTVAPTLTLIKNFLNTWGTQGNEDDFTFYLDSTDQAFAKNTPTEITSGTHTFGEFSKNTAFRQASITGTDCQVLGLEGSITADLGGSYTCTITNEDLPGTITIHKSVINDNGGTLTAQDFKSYIHLSGTADTAWELDKPVNVRTDTDITISEDSTIGLGYSNTSLSCTTISRSDEKFSEDTVILGLGTTFRAIAGQNITCTVINDDITPTVYVVKYIYGNRSNTYDFTAQYTENESHQEVEDAFSLGNSQAYRFNPDAGSVLVSEEQSQEWLTYASCYTSEGNNIDGGYTSEIKFDAVLNTTYYCTFQNLEHATLDVIKFNDANKNGFMDKGEEALDGWNITTTLSGEEYNATKQAVTAKGVAHFEILGEFDQGNFPLTVQVGETMQAGWEQTGLYCDKTTDWEVDFESKMQAYTSPTLVAGQIIVYPGGEYHCYIGNYKKPITVVAAATSVKAPKLENTGADARITFIVVSAILATVIYLELSKRRSLGSKK